MELAFLFCQNIGPSRYTGFYLGAGTTERMQLTLNTKICRKYDIKVQIFTKIENRPGLHPPTNFIILKIFSVQLNEVIILIS